jgi:hypothetical protein
MMRCNFSRLLALTSVLLIVAPQLRRGAAVPPPLLSEGEAV